MPDKTPPPLENIAPVSTFRNQKKIIIISSIIFGALLVIILVLVLFASTKPTATNSQGFAYLPEGICPDTIFQENGTTRADYQGMPYVLTTQQESNIKATCPKYGNVPQNNNAVQQTPTPTIIVDETEPPLLLKSVGFNLGNYDSATNTAGDIKFTKIPLPFDEIYGPFGQQDPRTTDPTKTNPQPTVILPLGTKVLSLVDGLVVEKKELYSGDWTVWVAKSTTSTFFYETEHIINVTVNVGDTVVAGQVIGEVSDFDAHNNPGFGLLEIGILHPVGTGVPEHVCPLKYLDASIKDSINSKLMALYAAWEAYIGKDIYKQETFVSAGCVVETPAKG